MNLTTPSICLFMGAALLAGRVVAADPAAPAAAAPAAAAISQSDFNAAMQKIAGETRKKPKASYAAYRAYLDETKGLSDGMRLSLYQRMIGSALAIGENEYNQSLSRFLAEPESANKCNTLVSILRDLAGGTASQYAEAEKLFAAQQARLTAAQRLTMHAELAGNALRIGNDIARLKDHLEACKQLDDPNAKDERGKAAYAKNKADAIVGMLGNLMKYDLDEAMKLVVANTALFDDAQKLALIKQRVLAAMANKDRAAFDAALADFEKTPDPLAKLKHYAEIARELERDDKPAAEKILRDALQNPAYNDANRHELLAALRGLNRVSGFNYGFHTPGSYEKFKALALEDLAVIERGLAAGTLRRDRNLAVQTYLDIATAAAEFGDYAFAEKMLAEARSDNPLDYSFVPLALRLALRANSIDKVRAVADPILANPKESTANKTFLKAVLFVYAGKDLKQFDAEVYGDQKVVSADRMIMLRRVSETMFRADLYDFCRKLQDEVFNNMFTPPEFKRYDVRFVKNAPKTADAWARSEFYNKWDLMETRFVPYGDGYDLGNATDQTRHLKDVEKPQLKPEYRTGVHIAYDETGLHIYVRCDDPDVEEIVQGKRNGDSLELLFRPGEDAAYHSWYFEGPPANIDEPHLVNWATPTKHYRLTYDNFKKDAVATPEGVVVHTFIPWLAFYDNLPINGKIWKFGLQRWGKANSTLNGNVHELERALQLQFAFTPQELTSLKRNVAVMAFNRYNKIRQNQGDFIQTWNDKVLGDPEFYKAEVEGLVTELDEAGKNLMSPAPDAEIPGIFDRYAPQWAEIGYVIADRRTAYLKKQMLR